MLKTAEKAPDCKCACNFARVVYLWRIQYEMRDAAIKLSWTIDCHLERKTRISRQCFPIIIILKTRNV